MTKPGPEASQLLRDAGAVIQTGFEGLTAPDWMLRGLAAGEIGGAVLFYRNIADPGQLAALNGSLAEANPDVLVAIDEEGGDVTRLEIAEGSSYPGNLALGQAGDPELTAAVARAIGLDLAAAGVNLNYAPVADVNANPDNPVIGVRSFGAQSESVSAHTAAYVRGLQSTGVIGCAKHFPGHGDTNGDSHLGLPRIDFDDETLALHLAPFRAAIAAGVKAIMTAHILVPRYNGAVPATMAPEVMTGLLRTELGFDGLIVTDGIDMGAISAYYGIAEGTVKAVAAGVDAICAGGSLCTEEAFLYLRNALVWAVRERRLPEERLHEAAERNRAAARWSAAERARARAAAEPADLDGRCRAVGLTAARRALRLSGDLKPLPGAAHVVEFSSIASIAVDAVTPWGVAGALTALLPGTTATTIAPPIAHVETVGLMSVPVVDQNAAIDLKPLLAAATGRPLVLAVRDLHRNAWVARAVTGLLAERPDAILVEMGVPHGLVDELADRGTTVLATHGSARVCGQAAAELISGRVG
ncbi:MAG TPA: glycoside hydrolase family 3 N-terminal domain-containing protein [Actinocrinis sp.]|nr:glycoside hydrolase family 3 N-terminal domain-containing protein [Actinocrinis sp.]